MRTHVAKPDAKNFVMTDELHGVGGYWPDPVLAYEDRCTILKRFSVGFDKPMRGSARLWIEREMRGILEAGATRMGDAFIFEK